MLRLVWRIPKRHLRAYCKPVAFWNDTSTNLVNIVLRRDSYVLCTGSQEHPEAAQIRAACSKKLPEAAQLLRAV